MRHHVRPRGRPWGKQEPEHRGNTPRFEVLAANGQEHFGREAEAPPVRKRPYKDGRIHALRVLADAQDRRPPPHQGHREGLAGADGVRANQLRRDKGPHVKIGLLVGSAP